jgi:hypothetical protein
MAKPEQIADPALRERVRHAHDLIRGGKASDAVRELADVYLDFLRARPEVMERTVEPRPGRRFPAVMQWPAYGANLTLESVLRRDPEIEFTRERFSTAEALTYLEYTIESIAGAEASAPER